MTTTWVDSVLTAWLGKGKGKGASSIERNEAQGIKDANGWSCFNCGSEYHLRGNPGCRNRVTRQNRKQARLAVMSGHVVPDLKEEHDDDISDGEDAEDADVSEDEDFEDEDESDDESEQELREVVLEYEGEGGSRKPAASSDDGSSRGRCFGFGAVRRK